MANYFITPNMDLTVPYVIVDPGPDYANNVNNCLTLIDQHDHSSGKGIQITPSGLNINTALTFGGNPATNLSYLNLNLQSASPGVSQSLFVQNGSESPARPDLWYNDGTTNIQLTNNGNVNATIASLPGQSYGAGTFTWKQGTGSTVPAAFDIGSITLRPNVAATTNGITLQTGSISSSWTLTLPALPATQSFLAVDTSGNITGYVGVSNLTTSNLSASADILGSQLSASAGIVGTQLSSSATIAPNQLLSYNNFSSFTTASSTSTSFSPLITLTAPTGASTARVALINFMSNNSSAVSDVHINSSGTFSGAGIGVTFRVRSYTGSTTYWSNTITISLNANFPGGLTDYFAFASMLNCVQTGSFQGTTYALEVINYPSGGVTVTSTINSVAMNITWI